MTPRPECHCHFSVSYGFGPSKSREEIDRFLAQYHEEDCPERLRLLGGAYCAAPAPPTLVELRASLLVHELHEALRARRDHLEDLESIARRLTVAIGTRGKL